jgi:hypothetical protein
MNLLDYFIPIEIKLKKKKEFVSGYWDVLTKDKTLNLKKYSIALFTILTEQKNEDFLKTREILYQLYSQFNKPFKGIDLGEIKKGSTFSDTLYATRDVCEFLIEKKIVPIIISDNSYIPYAIYLAFESLKKTISISDVNYTIKIQKHDYHYLTQILSKKNHTLFNYIVLGYQNFYTSLESIKIFSSQHFEMLRLGDLQANIQKAEPYIRDTDVLIINSSSIINSYLNEYDSNSPSGFTQKEICQLARYAGFSERISTFFLHIDTKYSANHLSIAQIIWHFLEGYSSRKNDFPIFPLQKLIKYHVEVSKKNFITFYKSPLTERWWVEVPIPKSDYKKKWLLSCNEQDYINACNGIIPDRWYKSLKKFF